MKALSRSSFVGVLGLGVGSLGLLAQTDAGARLEVALTDNPESFPPLLTRTPDPLAPKRPRWTEPPYART